MTGLLIFIFAFGFGCYITYVFLKDTTINPLKHKIVDLTIYKVKSEFSKKENCWDRFKLLDACFSDEFLSFCNKNHLEDLHSFVQAWTLEIDEMIISKVKLENRILYNILKLKMKNENN